MVHRFLKLFTWHAVAIMTAILFAASGCNSGESSETIPEQGSAVQPNPLLQQLPDNTALDLGRYECESRVPGMNCQTIFAYSRINYDPYMHRILAFGGGHAATGRTDVDVFNLDSLSWQSLYPSMTCEEVERGDIDPRGFHRSTGHPAARHTYDQNVVVEINGRGYLMMFSTEGFRGNCHPYRAPMRSVPSLALDGSTAWEYSPEFELPWRYSMPAEFDPVSGMVVLFGGRPSGPRHMWIYDPARHEVVASVDTIPMPRNASNLLYYPPTDRMYLIDRETMDVSEITLNRDDWQASTAAVIDVHGLSPPPMRNFAYDSHNQVIGGIQDGVFHAFDPSTSTWHR
jgi:hypothetical protein